MSLSAKKVRIKMRSYSEVLSDNAEGCTARGRVTRIASFYVLSQENHARSQHIVTNPDANPNPFIQICDGIQE
jgi:hypothetical protein